MFTPLLTFQIVACWVADTVGLGDCAWSPPGDLPVPIAPSSHLDQPRISSPIVSPLIPAHACSYAWQRFSSSTSPTTWGQCGLHNLHNITKSSGHDTGWRKMFTPLLTFQPGKSNDSRGQERGSLRRSLTWSTHGVCHAYRERWLALAAVGAGLAWRKRPGDVSPTPGPNCKDGWYGPRWEPAETSSPQPDGSLLPRPGSSTLLLPSSHVCLPPSSSHPHLS
ncbi:hypothetical protein HPB51_024970 [Rhipicephalus microplus]|uniref:Secreted protein n=1 Tax=Rhipicephalus microplus TaxID=6941 RepID=A0A9J6D7G5_RHIMP|nr:hypothetical protein HPB51_024970 [Rhipicephalus microplus]